MGGPLLSSPTLRGALCVCSPCWEGAVQRAALEGVGAPERVGTPAASAPCLPPQGPSRTPGDRSGGGEVTVAPAAGPCGFEGELGCDSTSPPPRRFHPPRGPGSREATREWYDSVTRVTLLPCSIAGWPWASVSGSWSLSLLFCKVRDKPCVHPQGHQEDPRSQGIRGDSQGSPQAGPYLLGGGRESGPGGETGSRGPGALGQ